MPGDNARDLLLTYAELAQRLQIKPASAKKLAQRRKWVRFLGNDGAARVRVPVEAVPAPVPDDVAGDMAGDVTPDQSPPVSPHVAHLEGLVEGLRGQVEAERRRADAAEARCRDLEGDRDAWREQARKSLWARLWGA